jgi:hypothetical protein
MLHPHTAVMLLVQQLLPHQAAAQSEVMLGQQDAVRLAQQLLS